MAGMSDYTPGSRPVVTRREMEAGQAAQRQLGLVPGHDVPTWPPRTHNCPPRRTRYEG